MNKISDAFANGKAFIPFITCGDPDLETTAQCIRRMVDAGADLIQLGIPFSDPVAEGPVIQEANIRALKHPMTTDTIFEFVTELRKDVSVPFMFMTYANVVFTYGIERFMQRCAETGVQGMVLPDVPIEEKEEFDVFADKYGIALISLIAPTSAGRIAKIAQNSKGFIYVVSSLDASKTREQITSDLKTSVATIRENTDVPTAIGFGISTPEHAAQMAAIADGAIVGSAIIKLLAKHGKDAPEHIYQYVKEMKDAVRGVS